MEITAGHRKAAVDFLRSIDIDQKDINDDLIGAMLVFVHCLNVRAQRERKYKQLWKKYGWRGVLMHMDSKQSRIMRIWWEDESQRGTDANDLDDAFDLINYATFFIQLVQAGNRTGGTP